MRLNPLALLLAFALVGCSSGGGEGDGLSKQDQAVTSRADEIAKKSRGDWDKVSTDDKAYLTQEIGHGNEQSAKMFFMGMTGGLQAKGDPRAGGAPGKPRAP